jgi:hypothetical protein
MMTEGKESPDGENSTYNDVSKLTIFIFYENIITFYAALYHFFGSFAAPSNMNRSVAPPALFMNPFFGGQICAIMSSSWSYTGHRWPVW